MTSTLKIQGNGLENVIAATTRLSHVDGVRGRLVLAGHPIEDLAGRVRFEDAMFLLFRGAAPTVEERASLQAALGEARASAFERLGSLGDALTLPDAMDALRASVAHLRSGAGHHDDAGHRRSGDRRGVAGHRSDAGDGGDAAPRSDAKEDALAEAVRIAGAVAVFAAAWSRTATPLAPDPGATHAADYLRMATGKAPKAGEIDALDAYFVTVMDHGMNASTFAARVVASTASDTVSAVVAAIGALKGKLHGGAPGPVLDMLDAIGEAGKARAFIDEALVRGERIMGMGHRVYRVRDPRAFVLERAIRTLEASSSEASPIGRRLHLARAVESEAEAVLAERYPARTLKANVEFYTAVLLEALTIPRALFTATFAASRAAGWCAHIDEQRRFGKLIRPQSLYVPDPHDRAASPPS